MAQSTDREADAREAYVLGLINHALMGQRGMHVEHVNPAQGTLALEVSITGRTYIVHVSEAGRMQSLSELVEASQDISEVKP